MASMLIQHTVKDFAEWKKVIFFRWFAYIQR